MPTLLRSIQKNSLYNCYISCADLFSEKDLLALLLQYTTAWKPRLYTQQSRVYEWGRPLYGL